MAKHQTKQSRQTKARKVRQIRELMEKIDQSKKFSIGQHLMRERLRDALQYRMSRP